MDVQPPRGRWTYRARGDNRGSGSRGRLPGAWPRQFTARQTGPTSGPFNSLLGHGYQPRNRGRGLETKESHPPDDTT